jgi:hypothetical protein
MSSYILKINFDREAKSPDQVMRKSVDGAQVMRKIADCFEKGFRGGPITDLTGNKIGDFRLYNDDELTTPTAVKL